MAKAEANEQAQSIATGLKYEYKLNMSILIVKMTRTLILCFYEDDFENRTILFDKAMMQIKKILFLSDQIEVFLEESLRGKTNSRSTKNVLCNYLES